MSSSDDKIDNVDPKQNATTDALSFFHKLYKSLSSFTKKSENYVAGPFDEAYKMASKNNGIALIINQMKFSSTQCSVREGSDIDRDDLKELFTEMAFDVYIHDDLKKDEILELFDRVSKIDHSDMNCLIVIIMSHGDSNTIFAADKPYNAKEVWTRFSGNNCPSLAGKPKLFFIQACRGTNFDKGVTVAYSEDEVDKSTVISAGGFYTIPEMADILVMYATSDGHYAWRDPKSGSYFIQALISTMRKYWQTKDFLTILTFVNRHMAVTYTSFVPDEPELCGFKQMPSIVSTLTRLLYLRSNYENVQFD